MTGRAQEEMLMTTGQLASAGSSALEVTAPDETHIPAWPPPVPREIGTLPLSRLRRVTDYIREHLDQDLTLAQLGGVVRVQQQQALHRRQRAGLHLRLVDARPGGVPRAPLRG